MAPAGGASTAGTWPAPISLGHLQPAHLWVCPTPMAETAPVTGPLSAKEDWEIKKMLYAYCPKSRASCDQPWLSQNFFIAHGHARFTSIRGEEHWSHLVHPGDWVRSWDRQDRIIADRCWLTFLSVHCHVADLRSLGICKQGSKQDIFLPCTQ